ncbi:MAG: 3'-5' exonuclease, partial [Oscillospiraceae bacterium]
PLGRILSKIENIKLKEMLVSLREQVNSRIKTLSKAYKYEWQVTAQMQDKCKDSVIRLVELVKEFAELFDSEMRQRKSLTFDMVEHLALKLLCTVDENGNISQSERAGEINGCYHEVLVDEYQDTNNLQDALFYALSDDGKKLFMVGDVKQSIYGFRHANPENFLKRKDEYANFDGASNPSKIVLDANFRSRKGICDYINFFFQRVMSKKTGSLDYGGEEMLTFSAQYKERSESDVELHFLELLDEDDTRAEAEGKHIAAFIAKTMKSKAFLRDKKGGNEFRKAEFSDFAILLRSVSKNAAIYVEALKSRGIPVAFDSGDYFRTPEILTLMSILKTINNPSDDVALIAAMTSYAFGFSYSEIAEIRLKNRNERFIGSVVLAANKEDEKCKEFLEKIKKYRRLASSLTVSKLIDEILNTTMLAEIFSALDKGEQRRANLLNLKAYAEQFQKNSASNLFLFIRYIDGMADSGKSIGKNASGGNGVRIMSIHASKGLQFPICIIASNSAKINTSDSIATLLVSEKYGVGMMCNNRASGERFSSLPRQAIAIEAVNRNISEELRLLYVAMTRAEEKLVMILSEDNLAKSICTKAMSLSDGERLNPFDVLSARRYTDWIISTTLMHDEGIKLCEYAGIGHVPPKDSAAQI